MSWSAHPPAAEPRDAAPAAPLGAPAGGAPMPDLLGSVLGPEGLVTRVGISHAELVATTCDLVRHLLAVDECWHQPPGALADVVDAAARLQGGAWLVNPAVPSPVGPAAPRSHGAVGGAPVEMYGEVSALMVFSTTPRAWSARDLSVLVRAAALLGAALEATLDQQLSPDQVARARYDDLRRELLTVLNHELRTPLAGLTAGLELLEDLVDDGPAVASVVRRLKQNAARLVAMTDDVTILGDVATSESRLATARFTPPDAAAVIARCVAAHEARAGVDLTVEPVAGPVPVALPADDLREVVDRVLDNAVKFTGPDDSVRVRLTIRTAQLVVTVTDTGIGVPEDEHHRVGQPFFRATNARVLEKQGPGLGLAAAAKILRTWGGSLRLDSAEDRGTSVHLLLPRAEGPRPT